MRESQHPSSPDETRRGRRLSRRAFATRAAAFGVSASALGLLAAACGQSAPAAPPPPPPASGASGSAPKPAESKPAAPAAAPPAPPASGASGQQAAPAAKAGDRVVSMWWEGKLPYEEKLREEQAADFEKKNPGIKINRTLQADLIKVVVPAFSTSSAPDVTQTEGDFAMRKAL